MIKCCYCMQSSITRKPINWWGSAKRDAINPKATVVYWSSLLPKTFTDAHASTRLCNLNMTTIRK